MSDLIPDEPAVMPMLPSRALPRFLEQMSNLGYHLAQPEVKHLAGYDLYWVNLAEWKLRFSDRTPLIWVSAELHQQLSLVHLVESLQDVVRQQQWQHYECLVLVDGDGLALKARTAKSYFPRFIVIDAADQQQIQAAHSFTGALLDLICAQVPLTSLSPYQVGAPVEGSSFFGRQREIDKILRKVETNFAVVGIRRLGKSSLLKEVRRRLLEETTTPERIVWLDCSTLASPEHLVQELVRQLHSRELSRLKQPERFLFFLPDFLKRMHQMYGGRITILLDEADQFLLWTRHESWNLLPTIRNSVAAGHCRYIVAGFQQLLTELYSSSSPFYLAFEALRLEPFERWETEEVILRPMESLRIHLKNERAIVERIYADTRGHPLLVQFYCKELVDQLERERSRTISQESLNNIYTSDNFRTHIVSAFRDNVSGHDKLLVYALLSRGPEGKESFLQTEMYGMLQRIGCTFLPEAIDQTCDRLVLAGVLARQGMNYTFANPIFPRIMRANYNVEHLIAITRKELGL